MKVDLFDNTLICEDDDLQTSLSYIKDNRELPEHIERGIVKVISEKLGIKYDNKLKTEKQLESLPNHFIQKTVHNINNMFSNNSSVDYDNHHLSYLIYYLPINTFKIWKPLLDLHIQSSLKRNMTILDVGTGPGSVALGIIEFYKSLAISNDLIEFSLDIVLIDSEEQFLNLAIKMIEIMKIDLPSNLIVNLKETICTKITGEYNSFDLESFDIITMSNFITSNEGDNSRSSYEILNNFRKHLNNDGAIIIIEPGEEKSCIKLKRLRNELINNKIFNIYSPCIGIWEDKTVYNCACFGMVRSYWEVPKIFNFLKGKGLSKRLREGIPFNYIVLRVDGLKKYQPIRNLQHFTKLSELNKSIGDTVNIIAFIRTVIYRVNTVKIALCDGSHFFQPDGVWIELDIDQLINLGIDVKLVSGERMKLMKGNVTMRFNKISLELNKQSLITIEF